MDTMVQWYEGTRVRRYEGATVRGCDGTRVRRYVNFNYFVEDRFFSGT